MNDDPLSSGQDAPQKRRLFLERRGYVQKRALDATRLLPIVGLVLLMIPLIWPRTGELSAIETSTSTTYVFAIWLALIVTGAVLAHRFTALGDAQEKQLDAAQATSPEEQRSSNRSS